MPKPLLVRVHLAGATGAMATIATFLASSLVTDLAGSAGAYRTVRHAILLGLPVLVACLVTAGLTGRRLAGTSRSAIVRRKQLRLKVVAAIGLSVLIPCAFLLDHLAQAGSTGPGTAALKIIEVVAGTLNLSMLALNFRDGRRMTRRRKPGGSPLLRPSGVRP